MIRVTVIGADGFVGSAFVRYLTAQGVDVMAVTRHNYAEFTGQVSEVVIEVGCNSKKYLADQEPRREFDLSVVHRLRTLLDFPADFHVHISSVDVYHDLASSEKTREDVYIDLARTSNYGLHKLLAENLVRHYAKKWLIIRLAGMVGPGLRKNPVFDIIYSKPLRIDPNSKYQFMSTDIVAKIVWYLFENGCQNEIYNVCGQGLISPREIAKLAGKQLDLRDLPSTSKPRVVDINIEKISILMNMPNTSETIACFISGLNK